MQKEIKISKVIKHTRAELISNMKKVGMLTNPCDLIYKNSNIEILTLETDEIAPAQRYVLAKEIDKIYSLRHSLEKHGVDLFKLDGYVTICLEDYPQAIDVLPPVIEQSKEAGVSVKLLNDGMHRVFVARREKLPIEAVCVSDIPKELPYYAYPLKGGWEDVEVVASYPKSYVKKWYRIADYTSLYRDFNTSFQNVGSPRGHFSDD